MDVRQQRSPIPIRAVPFAAGVVLVGSIWNAAVDAPQRALAVLVVTAAVVLLAPRAPRWSLALVVLSAMLQLLLAVQVNPAQALLGAAFFAIGRYGSERQHRLAVGVIVLFGVLQVVAAAVQGSELVELVLSATPLPLDLGVVTAAVAGIGVLVVPLLAGVARQAREHAAADEAARRLAEERLQRSRAEAFAQAERARLARDVHDTVGHALTVVITQARLLSAVSTHDPDAVAQAAATVETVASSALEEVRGVLAGTVRLADVTVAELAELASSTEGVTVDVRGAGAPLVAEVGETAYRAVQELVTNALRHGDRGEPVSVAMTTGDDLFELTVRNPVPGDPGAGGGPAGSGLSGLRDRLRSVGGELAAGSDEREWSATVRIPLRGSA